MIQSRCSWGTSIRLLSRQPRPMVYEVPVFKKGVLPLLCHIAHIAPWLLLLADAPKGNAFIIYWKTSQTPVVPGTVVGATEYWKHDTLAYS